MKFDNHAPINMDSAEEIASASRDGGAYDGIGYNTYQVWHGSRFHLTHKHSDGCERNNKVHRISEHLGCWETKEELCEFLSSQHAGEWWSNEILDDLGFKGEEA